MTKREINLAIKRISTFYKGNPPMKIIARDLNVPEETAIELWKEYLASPPEVVKRRAKRRKTTTKQISSDKEPTKKRSKKSHAVHDFALKILPWGAGVIAAVALTRSIMFTFSYFNRTEDVVVAVLMASLFGLVAFLTPSLSILAFEMKNWGVMAVAILAFILFGSANVYITVQEMDYTKTVKEQKTLDNQEAILRGKARLEIIKPEIATYKANKEKDVKEYNELTSISVTALKKKDMVLYNRTRNNMAGVQERLDAADVEIKKRETEVEKIQNIPGFYTTTVLTEDKRKEARMMDTAFSIAIELVGPIFLVIALFI